MEVSWDTHHSLSCAHIKLQGQGWELTVALGEPWWGEGLFVLRVEISTNWLQEKLGCPGDEVSLLLRNAKRNPPSALSAQTVLVIIKVWLCLKLKRLFIITAESQDCDGELCVSWWGWCGTIVLRASPCPGSGSFSNGLCAGKGLWVQVWMCSRGKTGTFLGASPCLGLCGEHRARITLQSHPLLQRTQKSLHGCSKKKKKHTQTFSATTEEGVFPVP